MTDIEVRDTYVASFEAIVEAQRSGAISTATMRNQLVRLNNSDAARVAQEVGARERNFTPFVNVQNTPWQG